MNAAVSFIVISLAFTIYLLVKVGLVPFKDSLMAIAFSTVPLIFAVIGWQLLYGHVSLFELLSFDTVVLAFHSPMIACISILLYGLLSLIGYPMSKH